MRMDVGGAEERAELAGGADAGFYVVDITPKVLERERAQAAPPPREKDPLANAEQNYQYKVAPFDVLSVIVWDHPELTIPAGEFRSAEATGHPVQADGNMFYPHVGVVSVAGKTLPEIRELLTKGLARVIERPQLDVKVASFRGYKVSITGEVKVPSTLPITDVPMRALDAINLCQGSTPEADLAQVILTRDGKSHLLDVQAANEEGDLSQNWLLQNGDVLHVPDRAMKKVFVLGEVKKPSSKYMVKNRMSLADALSDAEWLDQTAANAAGIFVIRGDYDKPKVYRLDATSPDSLLLAHAFPLKPMDVVFVSTHRLTQWNRIVLQIAPTVAMVSQPALYLNRLIPAPNP